MNLPLGDEEEIIIPFEKKDIDKFQINGILIIQTNQLKQGLKFLKMKILPLKIPLNIWNLKS